MIFNIGSGPVRKLPVLDEAYPQDVNADAVGASVTFNVVIAEAGKPDEYTYQWYYDNAPVSGDTGSAYTRAAEKGSHSVYCIVTNKAGFVTTRTATVTATRLYLYRSGDENTAVTGGWVKTASSGNGDYWDFAGTHGNGSTGASTATKNASSIYLYAKSAYRGWQGSASVHTANKIDLTPYSKLSVNITSNSGSANIQGRSGNTGFAIGSGFSFRTLPKGTGVSTTSITNINSANYILIGTTAYSDSSATATSVTFTEVWLE